MPANRISKPSTVLGRQLGDELRRLRESAGVTMAAAAQALDCTAGKISRIENGRVALRLPDLAAMLVTYGITDPDTRDRLANLARKANRRRGVDWWHRFDSVLPETFRDYIALESMADSLRMYQAELVPGLLQTPDYIRAVTHGSELWKTEEEVEQFTQVRIARQARLADESPVELWTVLSEAVLLQQVGGPAVMREQLQHLLAMTEAPHIHVQIMPFSQGAHTSMLGPYLVLGFPEPGALDVVLMDNPTGSVWIEQETEVSRYHRLFESTQKAALSAAQSRAVIHQRIKEHRA